jgi:hypothetical protein
LQGLFWIPALRSAAAGMTSLVAIALLIYSIRRKKNYLQNRQSLELENRGGACANVDEVDILAINSIKRSEDYGFISDAVWTVSGSLLPIVVS